MLDNIYMSNHAINRFYERFNKLVSEKKIHRNAINMKFQHKSRIWTELFLPALENSTENRSLLNDTAKMIYFYDRYGFDTRFKFLDNLELRSRFVLCETDEGTWLIVTVMAVSFEKVKHNQKFNNPRNKLGSKNVNVKEEETYFEVENVKRNGDLTDFFKELDNKKKQEEYKKPPEPEPVIVEVKNLDSIMEFPHLIGVQSVGKKFIKKNLLWENSGTKRDEQGLIIPDEDQINDYLKQIGRCEWDFKYVPGRVKAVFLKNPLLFPRLDDGSYLVQQEFFGHIFEFKVYGFKVVEALKILKIYEAQEVQE